MSSSYDVGKTQEDNEKYENTKCKKSPDHKHHWEKFGSWPSTWKECKYCKLALFSK